MNVIKIIVLNLINYQLYVPTNENIRQKSSFIYNNRTKNVPKRKFKYLWNKFQTYKVLLFNLMCLLTI